MLVRQIAAPAFFSFATLGKCLQQAGRHFVTLLVTVYSAASLS